MAAISDARTGGARMPHSCCRICSQPFTMAEKASLDAKAFGVQNAPPFIHPGLNFFNLPADSESYTITPSPFPNYPAVMPAGGRINVISFTIPRGKIAVIRKMSIVDSGGNPLPPPASGKSHLARHQKRRRTARTLNAHGAVRDVCGAKRCFYFLPGFLYDPAGGR